MHVGFDVLDDAALRFSIQPLSDGERKPHGAITGRASHRSDLGIAHEKRTHQIDGIAVLDW
jgi:hypothetical protein